MSKSCIRLGATSISDTRQLITYQVTVIYKDGGEISREPYVVTYANGAYDVVTPISFVKVPSSMQLTMLVVRNTDKTSTGSDPPPPP